MLYLEVHTVAGRASHAWDLMTSVQALNVSRALWASDLTTTRHSVYTLHLRTKLVKSLGNNNSPFSQFGDHCYNLHDYNLCWF